MRHPTRQDSLNESSTNMRDLTMARSQITGKRRHSARSVSLKHQDALWQHVNAKRRRLWVPNQRFVTLAVTTDRTTTRLG